MSELEGQSQFLYEHRENANNIAATQILVFFFSFIFTYNVWWSGLFGLFVAIVGYYGTLGPVVQSKVSFVQFVRIYIISLYAYYNILSYSITLAIVLFSFYNYYPASF